MVNRRDDRSSSQELHSTASANASDYVRDLIRADQERNDKVAAMQRFVDDGLESGVGSRSKDELFSAALARAEAPRERE
ncbi:type II toxin-antitoxin system ParD family antitoxin [Ensifer sp. ENS01]|uniref:ribbon-helix-helix domain-containing protein n=1 Tax=Ensifer sp. ENS01 TaxID=2769293 RepID=UPI0032B274F7